MFEASGGAVNFIAVLVPALMSAFYGFQCLFTLTTQLQSGALARGQILW
jgi:hypothetical protein